MPSYFLKTKWLTIPDSQNQFKNFTLVPNVYLIKRNMCLLTISNCFRYAELELFACIGDRPWLNIAHITIPKENISLSILHIDWVCISGAETTETGMLMSATKENEFT